MSKTILQVNFNFWITEAEYDQLTAGAAEHIAQVPGLEWKIWLKDAQNRIGGGIYLFESRAAAEAYLSGPVISHLRAHPGISGIQAKLFGFLEAQSRITRAPVSGDSYKPQRRWSRSESLPAKTE